MHGLGRGFYHTIHGHEPKPPFTLLNFLILFSCPPPLLPSHRYGTCVRAASSTRSTVTTPPLTAAHSRRAETSSQPHLPIIRWGFPASVSGDDLAHQLRTYTVTQTRKSCPSARLR
jgi:hypothetical protein